MNTASFLTGLLPLVAFVIIDAWSGVKAGVAAALGLALLEATYTYVTFHTLDSITLISLGLVLLFGGLSFYTNHPVYIKMQPVCLGVVLGFVFLIAQCLGKPLLPMMMEKYEAFLPQEAAKALQSPQAKAYLTRVSLSLGWGFLGHALGVAYAAFYMGNAWWLAIRTLGFYAMTIFCMLIVR